MTLLTRLWLSVLTAMLIALLGSFAFTLSTARDYLSQQLFAQGTDAAAALALSLSRQGADPAAATVLVSALFDGGHFERVAYRDAQGRVVAERLNRAPTPEVPTWFANLFPFEARTGAHDVTARWTPAGQVEVKATSRFAHAALWRGALRLGALMVGLAVALGAIMTLVVRWVRRPLDALVSQANAIGHGQFVTGPVPRVPELRTVGNAMNVMVDRIAAMFGEQAARLDRLREAANSDEVTGLHNRGWFVGRLRESLATEASATEGALLLARINDLVGVNRRLGRAQGDAFIRALAEELRTIARSHAGAVVARLNGSDFTILLPRLEGNWAEAAAADLAMRAGELAQQKASDAEPVCFVGVAPYRRGESPSEVLTRADAALMRSEAAPSGHAPGARDDGPGSETPSPDAWRRLFDDALAARRFALASFPVIGADGEPLHREVMLRLLPPGEAMPLTAGDFLPAATRVGRIAALDLTTVELALDETALQVEPIAVNVSGVSVRQPEFLSRLGALLRSAGERTGRLWIEVSERTLSESRGIADLAGLAKVLAPFGCKLGIDHFGRDFSALPRLYEIRIHYLKIDGGFVAELPDHPGNQRFIAAMVAVANSLGIEVLAEGVATEAEWRALRDLGVTGATGPAVRAAG
jgi:diguanylate cyclase (GGDEF)-like protein